MITTLNYVKIPEGTEVLSPDTVFHLYRVSKISMVISSFMGLDEIVTAEIGLAGLLHDIGKFAIPFKIIHKQGPLTSNEYNLVKIHAQRGALIAKNEGSIPETVTETILHHHERWDGGGYPVRLDSERIPIGARVLAVSDTIDALASNRPYRDRLPRNKIIEELISVSGSQLDPKIVDLAVDLIAKEQIMLRS